MAESLVSPAGASFPLQRREFHCARRVGGASFWDVPGRILSEEYVWPIGDDGDAFSSAGIVAITNSSDGI